MNAGHGAGHEKGQTMKKTRRPGNVRVTIRHGHVSVDANQVATFTKADGTTAMAFTQDGRVWRWSSNARVVPLDAAKDYRIPVDVAAQAKAREDEVDRELADYRANQRPPSGEDLFEMRAAFGAGTEVVNVISGRRIKL